MPDLTSLLPCFEPIDATRPDKNFIKKFVLHEDMQLLLRDNSYIVTGEKGSGKSALCRYMEEMLPDNHTFVTGIPFNELRYADITHYISELAHLGGIDALSLTSAFWRCVIVISGMRYAFENDKLNLTFKETRLVNFLRDTTNLEKAPLDIFLHLVKALWKFIETLTDPGKKAVEAIGDTLIDLPPNKRGTIINERQLTYLRKYPFSDGRYQSAENDFAAYLDDNNIKLVFYLDGFDKLRSDGQQDTEALNLLFCALVDAVYTLSSDRKWEGRLLIKALIPHDRWLEMKPRDKDKWRDIHQSFIWRFANLKEFIRKRFVLHPSVLDSECNFSDAYSQFFPKCEKIFNQFYKVNEDAFEYVIRHTQYRPRQLQLHFIKLCKTFKDRQPTPEEIPNIIALSCKERVSDFLEEFRIDHPQLDTFLTKFKDCPNVLPYEEFYNWVGGVLRKMNLNNVDVARKVEKLYHIGFVGYLRSVEDHEYEIKKHAFYFPPIRVDGKKYKCEFYYEDGATEEFRNLDKDELVCIHPMFHDYCKLKPNAKYLIG